MNVNRTTRRPLAIGLALTLATSALVGCTTDSGGESGSDQAGGGGETIVVGFAQQSNSVSYRIEQTESIKTEGADRGYQVIVTDAQDDTAKQVSDVEDLVSQGVDYLVLSPREFDGLTVGLLAAKEAGIPVILVDREAEGVPGEDFVTYIGSDYIWEGEQAGQWLVDNTGGEARVVELTGTPGASSARDRSTGFHNIVDKAPGLEIIASQTAQFSRAEAQQVMDNLLAANRDSIDAVYAHNDEMALGAALAIKAAGLVPGEDIKIIGIDGQKDAFEAVQQGTMSATVFSSPYYGPAVFDVIDALVAGDEVEPTIVLDGYIVDSTNVEDKIGEAY